MANSGAVTSGQQATAAQYNNLRSDVVDPAIGHRHDGVDGVNLGKLRLQVFGDGLDGDVTIAADTGIIRDMYYRNLTVNVGATLITNGFRVFVQQVATINGRIAWNMDEHVGWATLAAAMTSVFTGSVNWTGTTDLTIGRQGRADQRAWLRADRDRDHVLQRLRGQQLSARSTEARRARPPLPTRSATRSCSCPTARIHSCSTSGPRRPWCNRRP